MNIENLVVLVLIVQSAVRGQIRLRGGEWTGAGLQGRPEDHAGQQDRRQLVRGQTRQHHQNRHVPLLLRAGRRAPIDTPPPQPPSRISFTM